MDDWTLGLPTQGQPANIDPNTEQIPRQREPEADPSATALASGCG